MHSTISKFPYNGRSQRHTINWEFQKDDCFLTLSALRKDRQSSTDLQSEFAGLVPCPRPALYHCAGVSKVCTGTWKCWGMLCSVMSPDSVCDSQIVDKMWRTLSWLLHLQGNNFWWRECGGVGWHLAHWKYKVDIKGNLNSEKIEMRSAISGNPVSPQSETELYPPRWHPRDWSLSGNTSRIWEWRWNDLPSVLDSNPLNTCGISLGMPE